MEARSESKGQRQTRWKGERIAVKELRAWMPPEGRCRVTGWETRERRGGGEQRRKAGGSQANTGGVQQARARRKALVE